MINHKLIGQQTNNDGACPCRYCKKHGEITYPKIIEVDGLFYAKCPKCTYYDPYEFLGLSSKKAIRVWNEEMDKVKYKPSRIE